MVMGAAGPLRRSDGRSAGAVGVQRYVRGHPRVWSAVEEPAEFQRRYLPAGPNGNDHAAAVTPLWAIVARLGGVQ
jgi:hypothetical protein